MHPDVAVPRAERSGDRLPATALLTEWALRLAGAALLGAMAAIHLHLYQAGYEYIHDIGVLFLLNGIAGSVGGLAVLLTPRRLLWAPALGGAAMAAGSIAGLVISVTHGLFGFVDTLSAPYATAALGVESAGTLVLLALAGLCLARGRRARTRL